MSGLPPGPASPRTLLACLAETRSLPRIHNLVRDHGRGLIGCDAIGVLLRKPGEAGGFEATACAGFDAAMLATLLDADGPAAPAIARGGPATPIETGSGWLVVAPFGLPAPSGAVIALWARPGREPAWRQQACAATAGLAGAVGAALHGALLMDRLPHLGFAQRGDGVFEPLGRSWAEYGLGPDECALTRSRLADMLHPDEHDRVLGQWRAAIAARAPVEIEHRLLHKDGQYRWFRTQAAPTEAGAMPLYVGSGTEIDALVQARTHERRRREEMERRLVAEITDRGRTEARLAKAERIEAVGQLTSGVAHDFNNLLTVIIGNIEFLETQARGDDHLDGNARDRIARRLAAMREAAERGGNLTRQLLAFARRQRLEPRPTDLNVTVTELRPLLPAAIGGGIEVETRLQGGLWPAFVDRTQIERMIINLALNAHDAMEVGGAIVIGTSNRPLGAEEAEALGLHGAGDYVEISVSDTGRGMTPAHLARAFEPFFTTKPPGKGSGLGLAQAYGFARQSGGIVTLSSAPGEGTRAAILLPRASCAAAHAAPEPPPPAAPPTPFAIPPLPGAASSGAASSGTPPPADASAARLVLLVDDDLAVREVTSTIVAEAGYRVIEAASGQEAMERLAEAGRVDLMVTDYAMPGMNGHELYRAARRHQPDLEVLFVTGYADLTALGDVPEQQILLKPFRCSTLLDKICGVLSA